MISLADDLLLALVDFHEAYGCAIREELTSDPPEKVLRVDLLREEWEEYLEAVEMNNPIDIADALADMVYVIFGTSLSYGIDLPAVLAEVHRSNMSKLGEDGKPIYREDGKVLKGPNFFSPDIAGILST